MASKRALITGITGQDGSYLAELLLSKDYEVHGIIRRSSSFNTGRLDHLYTDPHDPAGRPVPPLRGPGRFHRRVPDRARGRSGRGLPPGRPIARPRLLRHPRVHGGRHGARDDPAAGGDPAGGEPRPVLPGVIVGDVRHEPGHPIRTSRAASTRPPVRRGQGVWVLDGGELSRGLRHVLHERHPVQPRERAARGDLRHAEDREGAGRHPRRASGGDPSREAREPAGLGTRGRLRRGDVADDAGRRAGRLRDRDRRVAFGPGLPRGGVQLRRSRLGAATFARTRATSARSIRRSSSGMRRRRGRSSDGSRR